MVLHRAKQQSLELRIVAAMQHGSNNRVNSIGANQYVTRYATAVREV
jgi:hypothetical protein